MATWAERFDEYWGGFHVVADGTEEGFTWSKCTCGGLAGDRYRVLYQPISAEAGEPWEAVGVCSDCLMYAAYGDTPEEEEL